MTNIKTTTSLLSRTKTFQHSFSRSSFKNYKQISHHSFPLGPFPPDERKIPPPSSLTDASPEEVIVASNSYIWNCAHILNAVVLGEMSAIYISICNELWAPASAQACRVCKPCSILLPPQADVYGAAQCLWTLTSGSCPWPPMRKMGSWGHHPPLQKGWVTLRGKNVICCWLTWKNKKQHKYS